MAEHVPMANPEAAPSLHIPESASTVTVRIIDTTTYGRVAAKHVFTPDIAGLDEFRFPSYAFLISHASGRHILFDAGMRKDWATAFPPKTIDFIRNIMPFDIEKDIDEILDTDEAELGITSKDITDIIWSHHHFDHRGYPAKFPPSTNIIWGPGSTASYLPAYPTNTESPVCDHEFQGRTIRELDESEFSNRIGEFPAHDFFGDGSFYLLSSPGHTVGHLCGLARVKAESNEGPSSFIFMGGDCCHYAGIMRPSKYLPLPQTIPAISGSKFGISPCPGQLLAEHIHPERDPTKPFLKASPGVNVDPNQALQSLAGMQAFDAAENVFVVIAHDGSLLGQIDFYPKSLNDWMAHGWKKHVAWRFCGDFQR